MMYDLKEIVMRRFFSSIFRLSSFYGYYKKYIGRDQLFTENYPLSDIKDVIPIPYLFGNSIAYHIRGSDIIIVVEDHYPPRFIRFSHNLNEDYISDLTLEDVLNYSTDNVREVVIFNFDRLVK